MIGILDSNLSGLILAKEIINKFPKYQILYFADTARGPFDNKGEGIIKKCAEEGVDFLIKKGAKLIIVSDSSMSIALENIKTKVPIVSLMDWLMDSAIKESQNKRIGMIASQAVINSNFVTKTIHQIDKKVKVLTKATPLLWPLIREGWIKKVVTKKVLRAYLYELHCKQVDTLILADTAYYQLKDIIQIKIGKQVKIINSVSLIYPYLQNFLEDNLEIKKNLSQGSLHQFFVSDINNQAKHLAREWFGSKIELKEI